MASDEIERHDSAISPDDVSVWIFDLDNTLYPAACNLFAQVDVRINQYVANHLGLSLDEARVLQKQYFRDHGTTLRGMMTVHGVSPEDYLDYVHDIDVSPIPPNAGLDRALARLPGRKIIFTNGSVRHAANVTGRLGVSHHFDDVFDVAAAGYVPKPDPRPYDMLVERHGIQPETAVMVEDIARNLRPAAELGMTTVWIRTASDWGREDAEGDHIHHVADDLVDWLNTVTGTGS